MNVRYGAVVACSMDFRYFPLDIQTCNMTFRGCE